MVGEWQTVQTAPTQGSFRAVCLGATEHTTTHGNPAVKWTFSLETEGRGTRVDFITPLTGSKALLAYETATSLGLDTASLNPADAFGKRCYVTMRDGWVTRVRPWS